MEHFGRIAGRIAVPFAGGPQRCQEDGLVFVASRCIQTSLEVGSVADRYRHVDKEGNTGRAPEDPGDA